MHIRAWSAALVAALIAPGTNAAGLGTLNLDDASSIKNVAATVAFDTMSYYNENQTGQIPGKLPDTWWEGGFLFNMLIQYWFYTGDTSYNPTVTQGLLWQKGANNDYMPQNWTSYLGNDDQVFWGLAAMTAAEVNYPEESGQPSWVALAQGVFETQAARWDYGTCAGGLRWQLFPYQSGYTLKNSVSNGGFFQLAARLAYYTNNQTYADWAIKMWDWCASVPLLSENDWNVADSVTNKDNCTTQGNLQWTYNYGCFFTGAAYMYNHTNGDATWGKRVDGLLNKLYENFFPEKYGSNVLAEPACDEPFNCNRDQNCFKGLVASWLGLLTYLKPNTAATIMPKLRGSATAAAKACVGGSNGRQCGLRWWQPSWDGSYGIEQEASVLSLMSVQLIGKTGGPPLTATTGGKSKSDPNAGSSSKTTKAVSAINTSDRAGAGILTALVVSALVAGSVWLVWP